MDIVDTYSYGEDFYVPLHAFSAVLFIHGKYPLPKIHNVAAIYGRDYLLIQKQLWV